MFFVLMFSSWLTMNTFPSSWSFQPYLLIHCWTWSSTNIKTTHQEIQSTSRLTLYSTLSTCQKKRSISFLASKFVTWFYMMQVSNIIAIWCSEYACVFVPGISPRSSFNRSEGIVWYVAAITWHTTENSKHCIVYVNKILVYWH